MLTGSDLINSGFVHNVLGSTGIPQGAQGLPIAGVSGGNSCRKVTVDVYGYQ